ncbi:hypothetical protein LTR91_019070 [Friedmanniomyces endolithicus]|uniref:Armadillo repeat-containing protein 8 n=1 Tax=Friedmanniomyces endolithicus TaxID=329885 RepID=A0AAN6HBF7_9PEZI|nr:hypothetical protein LTR57_020211 [Friedmanniomyces endolithicus]KAK0959896.1 hypothetical protein LTS01_021191 [Friedmanniomyces endolithicus]KAK0963289.1 hypothetical protein LTR91_019070 [Friedmanniomyces endolithicus]KAK1041112.1 hypothetical protein LTS16_009877 [Friedmanniomyces endolithicus]
MVDTLAAIYHTGSMEALPEVELEAQATALRKLKNEIVGHDQRKERLVCDGVVDMLVGVLSSQHGTTGSRKSDANGPAPPTWSWTQKDEATFVICTLANGGAAFIPPLYAAGVPQVLMDLLAQTTAPRLRTATLQAFWNIVSAWSALREDPGDAASPVRVDVLTKEGIEVLSGILGSTLSDGDHNQQLQLRLIADIVTVSATTEAMKALLCQSPILDQFADFLAAYSIASEHVEYYGDTLRPPPSTPGTVTSMMSAICSIISGSTYRTHRFFLSPTIRDLFTQSWLASSDQRHLFGARHGFASTGEPLLPLLHIPAYGTTTHHYGSRAFPAMAALQNQERRGRSVFATITQGGDVDHVNAVCSWLLLLARSMQGHSRLVALNLLALVNNAIDADSFDVGHRSEYMQKNRERKKQIALLGVPLAAKLVQMASEGRSSGSDRSAQNDDMLVKEQACDVLALLVREFDELQVAAVDAGAIKYICPLLKKSFDPVPLAKPMWSARRTAGNADPTTLSPTRRSGSQGLPPETLHAMRCRQGALQALAALAEKEDVHRKAIVEAGVVPCIFDSLKPFPPGYSTGDRRRGQVIGPKDGSTTAVLLAACRAAKTMARSVSLLRTSLVDAGIAKPIFQLLHHADPRVQLAATDACINLLLEFSPMREDLIAEGVVKTLCSQAKRCGPGGGNGDLRLRVSSLWALKHLMSASPKEIKIKTLEELGTGWLIGVIRGEQQQVREYISAPGGGVSVGLSAPNAAGERVDLLNPQSSGMDVDVDVDEADPLAEDDDEQFGNDEACANDEEGDGEVMFDISSSTHYQASQLRSTLHSHNHPPASPTATHVPVFSSRRYLSSVRAIEQTPALRAQQAEVAVQEQALDFIRNLLNGEDCSSMFDHLLQLIGGARIFDVLTEKLVPVGIDPATGNGSATSSTRPIYGPSALIVSTVNILTHIANALPRHKQLLIAQKPLLKAWLPHFSHPDRMVRVACVWAVNSLTWIDDESDRRDARQRAQELRACGIEGAVRRLLGDEDLDVRERARTGVRQFEQL